ncbi:uncharacterized protein DS421_19g675830 [Arachis hypogaea]|uniref:Uncharacterized protein n=1 Tax=Arachis hypogaea TaxID=3818 RepID=A0A6B9VGV1_ARAHY|nr:uncharacterized protein DS421_19g675830 [Arachis hypogaea]
MSGSHILGRSNRSFATENWTRNNVQSRRGPISEWCECGCRPVLRWSGTETETHLNKPFFGCPIIILVERIGAGYLDRFCIK